MSSATQSHISGDGYGSAHTWQRLGTNQVGSWGIKATHYICINCSAQFSHYYDMIPDIFKAMKECQVPEKCKEASATEKKAEDKSPDISDIELP